MENYPQKVEIISLVLVNHRIEPRVAKLPGVKYQPIIFAESDKERLIMYLHRLQRSFMPLLIPGVGSFAANTGLIS